MINLFKKDLKENIEIFFQNFYIKARQRARGFIISHRLLDYRIGGMLVKLDIIIRKTGILNRRLRKGYVKHNGLNIYFGKEDSDFAAFVITNNDYETETREVIESILKRGDVFVDLGANIGFFTLIAARLVGDEGKVFAFEPTPSTRNILSKNVSENNFNNRVIIEGYAISDKRSKAMFSVTALSDYNSICADETKDMNTIEINTISLDEYFIEKGINRIDLIKMDIEGQEFPAMFGMKKINEINKNIKIIFEYHREYIKNNSEDFNIFNLLKNYGFNKFIVLFRKPFEIRIPEDMKTLENAASRATFNILAEKEEISK